MSATRQLATAKRSYREYRGVCASRRWQALEAAGARPQRLLGAGTGIREGAVAFDASWKDLLGRLAAKRAALLQAGHATTRTV